MSRPSIPDAEYPRRFERLRAQLREHSMDALLLGTGANLAYFTGYPSPSRNVSRPFLTLLPVNGEPVFFTHTGHAAEARRFSWISDIRVYHQLSRVPIALIVAALRDRGLIGKTIGMEIGFEQTLDFSIRDYGELAQAIQPAAIADASALLWRIRSVKSEAEINCIREACRITTGAYASTFQYTRAGMTEQSVYARMRDELDANSGGSLFLAITSGEGNYDLVTKPSEDRPLTRGDMLWMDAGCTINGYWSDFSRGATVGKPSGEQERAQSSIHQITHQAVERMRPGARACDIASFCAARLESLPFPITSSITQLAARVGHGMGLAMTEPPHLSIHDDTVLVPGMVITIEPGVATTYGTFHVEENVLITSDGCEILSTAPRQLFEIQN